MAAITSTEPITDAEILRAVVAPDEDGLSPESARALLDLRFQKPALDRMESLAERNRSGTLDPAERTELESYLRVGNFLNLVQAKARMSLTGKS